MRGGHWSIVQVQRVLGRAKGRRSLAIVGGSNRVHVQNPSSSLDCGLCCRRLDLAIGDIVQKGFRIILGLGTLLFASQGTLWCKDLPESPQESCATDQHLPSFEVAAITPVAEKNRGTTDIGQYGSPSFHMHGASLQLLLSFSFDVQAANFINAPHGLEEAVFDVDVKSDGIPLSYEELKPRMQQLLKQRFCLVATRGTKQVHGYVLVVERSGLALKPSQPSTERGSAYITQHEVGGTNIEMSTFASMLSSPAGRPVKDETGLQGTYTLKVAFASPSDEDPTLPSIFTAIKEQLGLELKPGQVPVPTLTVEHLNLAPSRN